MFLFISHCPLHNQQQKCVDMTKTWLLEVPMYISNKCIQHALTILVVVLAVPCVPILPQLHVLPLNIQLTFQ